MAPPSDPPGYCFVAASVDLHLSCSSLSVRVPEVTALVLRAQTFIYVSSGNSRMNLILEGTGLQFGEPGTGAMATSDFDHTRDAWWRIREFEGVTFVDTAPDGIAWVERMQIPTPFSLDHATFALGAGTYEIVNTPGRARFRCFNQPPPCN